MDSVAPRVKVGHHAESGRRPAGPPKLGNVPPLNFKRGVNYALCLQLLCPIFCLLSTELKPLSCLIAIRNSDIQILNIKIMNYQLGCRFLHNLWYLVL